MPRPYPDCVTGPKTRMGWTYVLVGQPKTVEEAVDRAQFFQHARQRRQPKTRQDVVRIVAP